METYANEINMIIFSNIDTMIANGEISGQTKMTSELYNTLLQNHFKKENEKKEKKAADDAHKSIMDVSKMLDSMMKTNNIEPKIEQNGDGLFGALRMNNFPAFPVNEPRKRVEKKTSWMEQPPPDAMYFSTFNLATMTGTPIEKIE